MRTPLFCVCWVAAAAADIPFLDSVSGLIHGFGKLLWAEEQEGKEATATAPKPADRDSGHRFLKNPTEHPPYQVHYVDDDDDDDDEQDVSPPPAKTSGDQERHITGFGKLLYEEELFEKSGHRPKSAKKRQSTNDEMPVVDDTSTDMAVSNDKANKEDIDHDDDEAGDDQKETPRHIIEERRMLGVDKDWQPLATTTTTTTTMTTTTEQSMEAAVPAVNVVEDQGDLSSSLSSSSTGERHISGFGKLLYEEEQFEKAGRAHTSKRGGRDHAHGRGHSKPARRKAVRELPAQQWGGVAFSGSKDAAAADGGMTAEADNGDGGDDKPLMDMIESMRAEMCTTRDDPTNHKKCSKFMFETCKKETSKQGFCQKYQSALSEKCKKDPSYKYCEGTKDTDGDGILDDIDIFPTDPNEHQDTDGDGVGNNKDHFDEDATEHTDSDGDGIGDVAEMAAPEPTPDPLDAQAGKDSDGDGLPDAEDPYPYNANCPDVDGKCIEEEAAGTPEKVEIAKPPMGDWPGASNQKKEDTPMPEQGYNEYFRGQNATHDDMATFVGDWQGEWPQQDERMQKSVGELCKEKPNEWCARFFNRVRIQGGAKEGTGMGF